MTVETVDTTAMDPIVYATTFNALRKVAAGQNLTLRTFPGETRVELDENDNGLPPMRFASITAALAWMER